MSINAVKNLTSQLNSAVLSNTGGVDATQTTDITTADSKALSASTRASSVAVNTAVADSKGESSSTRASSVSTSAATAASAALSAGASAATQRQAINLNKKNVGSVTDSDTGFRLSTAGDFSIGDTIYTKAASSAVFVMSGTTLTSSQACRFLLALDASGNGVVSQGNLAATSAAASLPTTSTATCPVAEVIVVAGASQHVPGTTTFSQTISAGGSVVVRDLSGRM